MSRCEVASHMPEETTATASGIPSPGWWQLSAGTHAWAQLTSVCGTASPPRPWDQEGGLPSPDTHHSPAMTTGLRCAQRSWGAQGTGQKHLPAASRVHCPAWLASTVGPSRWGWGWGMEADQEGRGSQLVLGKIAEQGAVFFRFRRNNEMWQGFCCQTWAPLER